MGIAQVNVRSLLFSSLVSATLASAVRQSSTTPVPGGAPVLKTAQHHAMQYYVSLPQGWTAQKTWPILVTVTGGLKNFQANADLFAAARGSHQYIIVTPVNLTNGGDPSQFRQLSEYRYSSAVWDEVDRVGWCRFDADGLDAVIADVRRDYHGENRYYITGHSAGAHLLWLVVLTRPGMLAGAVSTGGNFRNRCVETSVLAHAPHGTGLPIRGFVGEREDARDALVDQFNAGRKLAISRGFTNVSLKIVPGEDHNPMPAMVFAYLDSLRQTRVEH